MRAAAFRSRRCVRKSETRRRRRPYPLELQEETRCPVLPTRSAPPISGSAALQATIAILAMLPVFAGLAGVVMGPAFLGEHNPPTDLSSHMRFLSGLFLAFGIGWYSCIPAIEKKTERIRLLAVLTFSGGLARLYSLVADAACRRRDMCLGLAWNWPSFLAWWCGMGGWQP